MGAGSIFCVSLPGERAQRATIVKAPLTILLAEDDAGHGFLGRQNLECAGLPYPIQHSSEGQALPDFVIRRDRGRKRETSKCYISVLDIRMPKVDGVEVLRHVKADSELRKMPVIMLATPDDPIEVRRCHEAGCHAEIQKPVDDKLADTTQQPGMFLVPAVNGQM
jgi:CheY-like chemotaxis protein